MFDIVMASSIAVFEAAISVWDKIVTWNLKKMIKYENKIFLHEFKPESWPQNGVQSLQMRTDDRKSADIIHIVWRISQFCASRTIHVIDVTNI